MKGCFALCLCLILVLSLPVVCQAHFGLILPDKSMVMQGDNSTLELILALCHPFEQQGMDMAKPKKFGLMAGNEKIDLLNSLQETKVLDKRAWKTTYTPKKPDIYTFYFDPTPYWEPAENKYIVHQTKTIVAAFGDEEGWDKEVGLKAEIVPLTRPFGLYAGNVFQGVVKFKGKPVAGVDVEVENWNDKKLTAPNDYFVAQVVKTDKNGVFTFAVPKAGWWGFSALNTEKQAVQHTDGTKKDAEYGAVLWSQFMDWPSNH